MLSLMLGGCASSPGAFPSLAPRPIEKAVATHPPSATTVQSAPLDPEAQVVIRAGEQAHAAFLAEMAEARPIIASAAGTERGGEAWVSAQQALSRLNAKRGGLASAIADLDGLRRDELSRTGGEHAAIEQGAQRLNALAAEEDAAITELGRALP
jgi:hypothetical protein